MTQTHTDEKERWQRLQVEGSVPEAVKSAVRSLSGDKAAKTWEDYVRREAFSYDPEKDPLYANYARLYTQLGQQAMEDTVGKGAALTGGYDNSYAQTAGQQAYGRYLQQLSALVPELYDRAYDRYQAEGEALYNQILLQTRQQEQQAQQQEAAFDRLMGLMEMGYGPTDDELAEAGMTRAQADSILDYYRTPEYTGTVAAGSNQGGEPTQDTEPEEKKVYAENVELTYEKIRWYLQVNGLDANIVFPKRDWFKEKRLTPKDPQFSFANYDEYLESIMEYIRAVREEKKMEG